MDIGKFFESVFLFYYGKVYSYAHRRLGSKWAAEEVTQSVFEKLWLHHDNILSRHTFRSVADMNGYIFAMTRNAVVDWHRDNSSIMLVQEEFASDIIQVMDLSERLDLQRCLKVIDLTVNNMPQARRRVFVMSRYQNIPNAKIATILGISKRTVEKHLNDALRQLRIELATQLA
jgi:RNA polymerase sigma-70 factor (ECF subfamily)